MQLSWTEYKRLDRTSVQNIRAVAGVYRISVQLQNGQLRVIYVGQTNDLNGRLWQYLNGDTKNLELLTHLRQHICYFRAASVIHQSDRDACERALFDHFSPECNDPTCIPYVLPANINFE